MTQKEHRTKVHAHRSIEVFDSCGLDCSRLKQAVSVHEDVDPPSLSDHLVAVRWIAQVGADRGRGSVQTLFADVDAHDLVASVGQCQGGCVSSASRGSGDECTSNIAPHDKSAFPRASRCW